MKKRTILVVDDEKVNRRILSRMLDSEYEVIEATNGQEALTLLRSKAEQISAVLLDIIMPVMDGYEVLSHMAEDAELSKIPVIVSSQKDGDEAEVRALSRGAQDFIAKPYKAEIICRRLSNLIKFRETASLVNKVERDELTGLYNKQFFTSYVSDHLHQHPDEQFDLMCIGIERFRLINDTFGTLKGDELLRYIASLIQSAQRPICAARFSADLFFLLVPHREKYDPALINHWYSRVNEFPINMDIKLHCGIYAIDEADLAVSTMCDRAQLASEKNKGMYDAPFFLYDDSLRQRLLDEQFIISNMRLALEQGQFHVYYQPKYDLANEHIAGAEALVRWINPEKGFISPGLFIPLFERSGFISELDHYVWESACRDMRGFIDRGLPAVAISVNVSRADIYNPQLSDILLGLLKEYDIPIRYLHLEITESAYVDNPEQIVAEVGKLRKLGFVVEMDDFGSGYSSLNMLAEMPVDVMKLDMRFIQSETSRASGKGILSFVISLAKWLDLAVVAEGVETGEQIAILRSMDCNYVQGFYFARPMKRSDFEALLNTSKTTEMICNSQTVQQYMAEQKQPHAKPSDREMLIVDDMDLNRAVLAGCFEDEYSIVEKANGSEALDYLDSHFGNVEIIMLDLLMPVMDGFQFMERIRADSRMRDIPIIVTSQGDAKNERRALQMQADDFISKPYNPDIIRHRVHNVLASRQLQKLRDSALATVPRRGDADSAGRAWDIVEALKPHFDIVRLVEPAHTLVLEGGEQDQCELHACYAVWGKSSRCRNCTSMKAFEDQGRHCKLERRGDEQYFVISEYIPYADTGAVIEMVGRLSGDTEPGAADAKGG